MRRCVLCSPKPGGVVKGIYIDCMVLWVYIQYGGIYFIMVI